MRLISATLCLTLAVLLGSVTVSWGDDKGDNLSISKMSRDEFYDKRSYEVILQEILGDASTNRNEYYDKRSNEEIIQEILDKASVPDTAQPAAASSAAAKTKETGGKTFEECILDDMPDVGNEMAASVVISECIKKPKAKAGLKSGSWFGPSSPNECMMKYGKKTKVQMASELIFVACRKLYKK